MLRNVGGGEEGSGSVSNYCDLFLFIYLFILISIINCFYRENGTTVLNPTVLGTMDFRPRTGHVVPNLQLESIPPPPSSNPLALPDRETPPCTIGRNYKEMRKRA